MESSPTVTPLRVSFVIPAMNEATMIVGALDSIRRLQQRKDITVAEVIVVDSGSTDATPEIARAAGCQVIPAAAGNVSASRNLGAAHAVGNVLAFLDADCELPETWLLRIADEFSVCGVVAAGMQMAGPPADAPWVERTWYTLAHQQSEDQESTEPDWLATFNLAVQASVFRELNGFDVTLTTCEDVDLGYRLSREGKLRFIPRDGVRHYGESKSLSEFFRREAWRARGGWQLLRHHGSSPRELVSCLIPFTVIGSLLAGLAASWWAGMAAIIAVLPLLAMVFRRRPGLRELPAAIILQTVYFAARCRGMLRPARRVERQTESDASTSEAPPPVAGAVGASEQASPVSE